ncbi:acylneuraminate cytidylyltransferase [Poseidonocella sedimentorum]|uniref:N-acylneuraminate cytidylyltransferase n=1 Tax=Poseidonocella sedimentorum TaxID=871652 RepID=A0A1I6EDP5_9RHOB|nr:acylneuraminate cytidylyltransferase [Poseidonocella sedimentorum]SFR15622.1 N-acylneuraminate cytidylyltransferase [Poseidonocella sedimentorum]
MTSTLSPAGSTACVILARGGSKGVPGKNLRKVGGLSLVARAVRAGVAARGVAATYVSTDSPGIAAEARAFGARVIARPEELSGDSATSESGWLHALSELRADLPDVGRLVFLQCTSPFTTGDDIDRALAQMAEQDASCALSVTPNHTFLWHRDDAGFGRGTNHDETRQRQRRQDLPPAYGENGAFYCVDVAAFEKTGQRFCGPVALCPVDHPPLEIDSVQDLELCALIANSSHASDPGPERLEKVRALVMDFDGVHTDNLVHTDQDGRESVTTSRGDGMGLSMLRDRGDVALMILSKERNPVVLRRAEKLRIEVQHAVDDKVAALEDWLAERQLGWANLAYIGNDLNDLAALERAGLSVCPSDSHPEILAMADWVLPQPGGRGALRHLCDALLRIRE